MVGRLAAWSCGVPIVVHTFHGHVFHSYFGSLKTKIIIRMEQFLAKISTKIVVISPAQQDEIVGQFKITSIKKSQVIQLGFDLMPFHENLAQKRIQVRNQYQVEDNEIAVAIVGRLAPIKNHKLFLDAIEKILPALTQKVKFFIVGDGTERAYIEQRVFEINKKRNCIELTSWIKDIATFNAGMDLICLSSDNEGTPVSLIEAQAANLPVLTTDVGGVKDIVLEGETGYIVPKNDLEKYAEKLLFLIENENIRQKMSQNGWTYVQEKFSYKTLVKNMESMYDQLIKENEK
jgi:glycosyltransferase involved in cell wall biosynthesis